MKIKKDYDGASIEIVNEENGDIYLSVKKEKEKYCYYYNFFVENDNNDTKKIHIKNFEKTPYYLKENIPIPYIKNNGKWEKISNNNFNSSNPEDIIIKIPSKFNNEISLFPRYNNDDLKKFLKEFQENKNIKIKNNELQEIIIGNEENPAIVMTARQHPGETLSSFFLEGIIQEILSNEKYIKNVCYVIFPIVSINGVKNGNHRLTDGIDYNRSWMNNKPPKEIEYIKKRMGKLKLKLFVDIHCDEITKKDYIRTNNKKTKDEIAGIQVLEDMSKIRRFFRALIKQKKIIKFSNMTAREFISKKFKCENMLIELTLQENDEKARKKGKEFIKCEIENF